MDEESSEKTEDDERIRRLQSQSLATRRFTQGEGSCDVNAEQEDSRGDEARARGDGEDDENEGECGGGQDHTDCQKAAASGGVLGGNVGGSEMEDQEMEDEEMEDEEMKDEGQNIDVSAELTSKRRGKRTAESSPKRAAPKKQTRRKVVQDARLTLDAAAGTPGEAGVESKSKARVRKTSQPRKPVRPSRHPKSDDSSDDVKGWPLDTMAVVLHAEGGNLRKVTRAHKSEAEIVELNVDEEQFKRCTTKHGGEEGNEREVYERWERHPKRLQKLCSSFLHEDEGVILIRKSHAGLVWELLRAGHHVSACDSSSKDISYLTKVIEILGKDARNECTVKRQKTAHRPDRDMYHKLCKKRNKMWEYLFQGQPKTPFEHDYIVRKAMAQEAYSGYHKAQVGSFAMFVARCERMEFGGNQAMLTYDGYSKIAKEYEAWNPIESDEETETSDLEIEERVKRMREGMKSVPACNAPSL
ncbi:hypothetical protein CBR_g46298 [Chara braunii]|uniref:Uncharacterized protein n=1 Tax=Chara braunii TaxID=69332 RepID=A0A388M032_CHABU|nr:hypothetical protein CBR_g46298 [Chara braunii]|eukprot:GBG87930.1 hypothetical protein CBR_g46298 [Chara braunii]